MSSAHFWKSSGLDFEHLAGVQVKKIEGKDVWEYLVDVGTKSVGTYQDKQQRLNSLFARTVSGSSGGYWGRNAGTFTRASLLPGKDNFTMTVDADGTEVNLTVPWLVTYSGQLNVTSGED